jgi:hypothetical protein
LLHADLLRKLNAGSSLGFDYGQIRFYNNAPNWLETAKMEHRLWGQYLTVNKRPQRIIELRLRGEYRMAPELTPVRSRFKVRYLWKPPGKYCPQQRLFFNAYNEIFINHYEKAFAFIDRNRLYLAAGFKLDEKRFLKAGWMRQDPNGMGYGQFFRSLLLGKQGRFNLKQPLFATTALVVSCDVGHESKHTLFGPLQSQ